MGSVWTLLGLLWSREVLCLLGAVKLRIWRPDHQERLLGEDVVSKSIKALRRCFESGPPKHAGISHARPEDTPRYPEPLRFHRWLRRFVKAERRPISGVGRGSILDFAEDKSVTAGSLGRSGIRPYAEFWV